MEPSDSRYILKMVKPFKPSNEQQLNGLADTAEDYVGTGADHVMVFETQDVIDLDVSNVMTDNTQFKSQNGRVCQHAFSLQHTDDCITGASSGFRTDTDISGNLTFRERNLKRWEPSAEGDIDLSLDDNTKAGWDQFEANERLYGLKSDYDENLYTTTIDRSHPLYKQRAAAAERTAREIESSGTMNAHVAEERGHDNQDDNFADEEQK